MINDTIYLIRSGVSVIKEGATGERGELKVGSVTYPTIERGGGYVTLPNGTFEIIMEESPTKTYQNNLRKQFRIYGHGVKTQAGNVAALLIHLGNYPNQVQGCIAPGKNVINNGVGNSANAMQEIFNYFGGFAIGKKRYLKVTTTAGYQESMLNDETMRLTVEGIL